VKATVSLGPKGGIEFRLWTGEDTFLVVGKFKALPHMDENQKVRLSELEAFVKAKKDAKCANASAWSAIMSGRTEVL
jgi:hypothetical protein